MLPLRFVKPITEFKQRYEYALRMVKRFPGKLNGLSKPTAVDLLQLRSVFQMRLMKKLGSVSDADFELLLEAVKVAPGIY